MIDFSMLIPRFIGSALTLYMLAICLRWLGPYVEADMDSKVLRYAARLTDPLISLMRDWVKHLGPLGPVDWGPIAALLAVWVLRLLLLRY